MFQKYNYVLTVAEERSFTKAARRLFISQPSLSVAIRNIEKEVGMPLFERRGTAIHLTEIGEAYVGEARKMQQAEEEFGRKLAEINGLQTGRVVVGGSNYLTSDVFPRVISRFRDQFPGIEIVLTEANSVNLRNLLQTEEVDVVIDNFEVPGDHYETHTLAKEQILLCVPSSYVINQELVDFQIAPEELYNRSDRVAQVEAVDISAFKDECFILLKDGNDMYDKATAIFEDAEVRPCVDYYVDQLNISHAMAESGLGACFLADTFFKYRKHTGDVVLYKLKHEAARRTLHIAYKRGRYCTRAMACFIELAQEIITE